MTTEAAKLSDLTFPPLAQSRGAARPASLQLEIVRTEAGLLALAPSWDALLARSATRTPFLAWDWIRLWWEEYRDAFQLAVAVVRDSSGVPLAIAPLTIGRPTEGARRHLRHLTFLGGIGEITSEGLDFMVPRGQEALLSPLLCEVFRRTRDQWDTVLLPMIPETSPNLPHILAALNTPGAGAGVVGRHCSHFISLPDTWEGVEMSHGQNWRSNHRRKWKKMLTQHGGLTRQGGRDLAASESLDALITLHARRWSAQESLFLRERALRFHRKLVELWLPTDRLSINILELDGAPGAATYCFHHDGRAWFYQAGWNTDYGGISIGKMAVAWAVQCAIGRGLREFDFLPGDLPYKQEWGNAVQHVVDVEAFHPLSPRAAMFRLLRFCKRRTRSADTPPGPAAPLAHEGVERP
jgi:CelD/BcsL family acetyltransferase involved in cellulose biosynthesis